MNLTQDQEQYAVAMLEHYIECALWSSTVFIDDGDNEGENANNYDASHTLRRDALEHCREFVSMAYTELLSASATPEQAGHDLWLTRNGHGSGFWDRGYINGDKLTELADSLGSVDCYLDEYKVYFS